MSAVIEESANDTSTEVEAVLNYTRSTGRRSVNYTFDPPPGVPRNSVLQAPLAVCDAATLIKIFDSATDGRARLTAHTAFDDPTSEVDSPPRRSIEIRSLVFW